MQPENSIDIRSLYKGLTKPGRRGVMIEIARRVGCTGANVSSVLRGKSTNDQVLLVATQVLLEIEEQERLLLEAANQNLSKALLS